MIYADRKITITKDKASIDAPIILYRGDRQVEIRFTILSQPFKFRNQVDENVIESSQASYGQLVVRVPNDKPPIFSEVSAVENGMITFVITKEMIDEIEEVGYHDIQIRLLDESKQSRASIPPVANCIQIREPIAIEDNLPITPVLPEEELPIFNEDGSYNETLWTKNSEVTVGKMNKIEGALSSLTTTSNSNSVGITKNTEDIQELQSDVTSQGNELITLQNTTTTQGRNIIQVQSKNTEQDATLETHGRDISVNSSRLDSLKDRVTETENVNNTQNERLDTITSNVNLHTEIITSMSGIVEGHNTRLQDVENKNAVQDANIRCLYESSNNTSVEHYGNDVTLQNVKEGTATVEYMKGETFVNCNKESDKELILSPQFDSSADNHLTITEARDGSKADVYLEGNTMVNVCDQKDPIAITKSYSVETGNHVALQGEYDGKCRPIVTGNTLVNLCIDNTFKNITTYTPGANPYCELAYNLSTSNIYTIIGIFENYSNENSTGGIRVSLNNGGSSLGSLTPASNKLVFTPNIANGYVYFYFKSVDTNASASAKFMLLKGDYTNKPIPGYFEGLQSSFEDKVVIQEMVDAGEELAENLGKYKVDYVISREDGTVGFTKTFYLNSPLLEGDTIEQQGDNVVHVHRSELRAYETDDELTLPTDMTNTLVAKASPQYEVISQNDTILCDSYINGHLDVDSAVPIERVDFLPFEEELTYLYPSTQYAVQFVSDAVSKVNITLGGAKLLNQDVKVGTNKYMITTPSELVDNKLVVSGVGLTIEKVVVTNTDQDFGYFEGMKSVGECEDLEVVSSNKNLIDLNNTTAKFPYEKFNIRIVKEEDKYKVTGSNVTGYPYLRISDVGELKPNTKYGFFCKIEGEGSVGVRLISRKPDGQNGYISFGSGYVFTTPNEPRDNWDIDLACSPSDNIDKTISELILFEYNDRLEDYIPHAHNTQTLTHEPLRGIGKIKDKYVLIDGKWYIERNCGVRAYQEGDIDNYITDMINTVYPLSTPTYEPIDYNPFTVYSGTTHITTNSTIPTNIIVKNHGFNCMLKPSTKYTLTYTKDTEYLKTQIVTPPTLDDSLRFYGAATMKDLLVLEGTPSIIPSNFSGIESAFEQELVTDESDENYGKYKVRVQVVDETGEKESNVTVYLDEPLRGIGDVKDKLYVDDHKVIVERNCGSVTLDGSEDEGWKLDKQNSSIIRMRFTNNQVNNSQLLCDKFITKVSTWSSNVITSYTNVIYLTLGLDKVNTLDPEAFKQWLQQNPVTVVYQLAEPVYEEVDYPDIKLYINVFNNSTLYYNSNTPVSSLVKYPFSVQLVDEVANVSDISDQQDSMIIDLATQVSVMEMMLM